MSKISSFCKISKFDCLVYLNHTTFRDAIVQFYYNNVFKIQAYKINVAIYKLGVPYVTNVSDARAATFSLLPRGVAYVMKENDLHLPKY